MAFLPAQNRVNVKLPVLDGGLNTKFTDVSCPLNSIPDGENVLFDEFGAIRTCLGYSAAFDISTGPIDCMGVYHNDTYGQLMLVAASNGDLYAQVSTATFAVISGSTGIYTAPTSSMEIVTVTSFPVFSDGQINPYKWDDGEVVRYGSPAPQTGNVQVTWATTVGDPNGIYNYALTYVNKNGVESDYTVIVTGDYVPLAQNELSSIPVPPSSYGVATKNLYRTTAAANTLYWKVTALTAGATVYIDNAADGVLNEAAPLDHGMPPKAKYMCYYRGRVWAAGDPAHPYRLSFSNAGEVETWPSTNNIEIEPGDTLPISGIEAFGNSIVIHKNDGQNFGSVYLLYIGDATGTADTTNWYVFKSPAAFSSVAHKSQAFFKNLMFYLNRTGCYAFTGQDLARTSADSDAGRFQVNNLTFNIDTDVKSWNSVALDGSAAIQFDNKIWLSVPVGSDQADNNAVYMYDFVRLDSAAQGVWGRIKYPGLKDFQVSNGVLYGGTYDGKIIRLHNGTSFNGTSISPYFMTAPISGDPTHREHTKTFRILYVTHDLPGDWDLHVEWYVDFYNQPSGTAVIPLGVGLPIWGSSLWGAFTWGATGSKRSRVIIPNATGKIIQFKFYTTGVGNTFKIKELELDYNLRSKRG